jgi:hypothetical protein
MSEIDYNFKGKITVEFDIDSDEDGMSTKRVVNVTGISKDQLYWLFEGADIHEDFGNAVYDYMAEMED